MRIAIIGTGISGLTCASLLQQKHELTLYEANDYIGGHTNTVDVELDGQVVSVDTGFIVFNHRTYPNFVRLLQELGVESTPTEMSFSVRSDADGLEYNGSNLNGLFGQRRNALRPSFLRMLRDILRFNRLAGDDTDIAEEMTVGEFLKQRGYSQAFADWYLLPMGAAIWSCPTSTFADFPIRFIVDFYRNHGLLQIQDRPVWRVITGGSRNYVDRMTVGFRDCIRMLTPVSSVRRVDGAVTVESTRGRECFDEVIFACHSDQALRMTDQPSRVEREVLSEFPYSKNLAVLHTDASVLPRRKRCWASWNYHIHGGSDVRPAVTYNMNILQHIRTSEPLCVTLNEEQAIKDDKVLGTFHYSHPIYTTSRAAAQQRHGELIRRDRLSYCGAYWGNGFHEDGVQSALRVCEAYGVQPAWNRESHSQVTSAGEQPHPLCGVPA